MGPDAFGPALHLDTVRRRAKLTLGNLTLSSFALLIFSITLGSFGQIFLKMGLAGQQIPITSSPVETITNIIIFIIRPYVLAGLALYVVSTFTWLLLISRVRLSVAYPMISISYVMVMLLSVLILREAVVWPYALAGLVCIGTGVSFIGLGLGQAQGK